MMRHIDLTAEKFLQDVAKHEMTVHLDNGIYRHLSFGIPGSSCYRFDITTMPGHLVFTGDMGSWTFSRLRDMTEFFRGKPDGPLQINPSYWSEKLVSASCSGRYGGNVMEYNEQLFKEAIWCEALRLARRMRDDGVGPDHRVLMLNELKRVRDAGSNGEHEAYRAVQDFDYLVYNEPRTGRFERLLPPERLKTYRIEDFYENNLKVYTYHFLWACYAIVWALRLYDESRKA